LIFRDTDPSDPNLMKKEKVTAFIYHKT